MKTLAAFLMLASVSIAGDCRHVGQVRAVNAYAYQQVQYGHGYVKAAIIAVEDPYNVHLLAQDLRVKNRVKELESEVQALKDATKNNADATKSQSESIRLLVQGVFAAKGADAGVLQQKSDAPADPVVPILSKHCAKCHSGDGAKGDVMLFKPDGTAVTFTPEIKALIESVVNDNSMPPGNDKLSADEYSAVRKWYEADRVAVRAALKKKSTNPIPPVPGELK